MRNYHENIPGTMFDFSLYYQQVAERLPDNCRVCEVGTAVGKSAIFLAEAILNLGKTIDRFVMVDSLAYGGIHQQTEVIAHLVKSGIGQFAEFWPMSSLDALFKFPGEYLDFVFIDSSHNADMTRAEIKLWWDRIKEDGYLAGHDYDQLKDTVDEIIPAYTIYQNSDIPTQVRTIYETEKGYGVWEVKKNWQHKLKS